MSEEQEYQLREFLREHLSIEVETSSVYTGGMDGSGQLYRDVSRVKLMLDGDCISESGL